MEHKLQESCLSTEPLPDLDEDGKTSRKSIRFNDEGLTEDGQQAMLDVQVEELLKEQIAGGSLLALFQLGQVYFEQKRYEEAAIYFKRRNKHDVDYQTVYQIGVMYYDGLGLVENQKVGFDCMMEVASSDDKASKHLVPLARCNVGRAYFEGFGTTQSDEEAERWWLLAADDGNPDACIKAQTILGMYYSREDTFQPKKAFFWHSEATGNGSLESQGALGVMYETGQGCKKSNDSAFKCFKEASQRGNVYAMGRLVSHYYSLKFFTKCAELAARVSQLHDVAGICKETDCVAVFIAKGIALACFYYGRCLHLGVGVKKDKGLAQIFYSKSCELDPAGTWHLQDRVTHGQI